MPLKMIRKPEAVKRTHPDVMNEVRKGYEALGKTCVAALSAEIEQLGWTIVPDFKYSVKVTVKRWYLSLTHDTKAMSGKIYDWVSEGTGERGGGQAWIQQAPPGSFMAFDLPSVPKSLPLSGNLPPSATADPARVVTATVVNKGIEPRNFGKGLYELLTSRRPGSFHNVSEASVKRGLRKTARRVY